MSPGDIQGSQDPCHYMCFILRNKNIWFMGGDLKGFRDITHFMK